MDLFFHCAINFNFAPRKSYMSLLLKIPAIFHLWRVQISAPTFPSYSKPLNAYLWVIRGLFNIIHSEIQGVIHYIDFMHIELLKIHTQKIKMQLKNILGMIFLLWVTFKCRNKNYYPESKVSAASINSMLFHPEKHSLKLFYHSLLFLFYPPLIFRFISSPNAEKVMRWELGFLLNLKRIEELYWEK